MEIAIIENNTIINVILAESLELAQQITQVNTVLDVTDAGIGIGWTLIDNKWVPPCPGQDWILIDNEWVFNEPIIDTDSI